jgi:hypothetical protein
MPLYRAEVVQQQITLHKPRLHDKSQVLYLPFDKDDGNYAKDRSGYNNHGVIYGATHVAGKVGVALSFNDTSNYVDVPNSPSLDITGNLTVMAWIYPTGKGSSSYARIVDKSNGVGLSEPGYRLQKEWENDYHYTMSAGGVWHDSSRSWVLNQWSHVAWTIDGVHWILYVNAVPEVINETALPNHANVPLSIGNAPTHDRPFQGVIDEVRVYNRALNQAEIQRLMNMRSI